jgi:hypothetical protein
VRCCAFSNNWSAALDETDQQNHNCNYEQKVDIAAKRVRTHQSQQPQDEQDYENCPQHFSPPGDRFAIATTVGFDARSPGAVARFIAIPGAIKIGQINVEMRITRLLFCATKARGKAALTRREW